MPSSEFKLEPQNVNKVKTLYRKINGKVPSPGTEKLIKQLEKYESRSMHGQIPLVWDKAKNFSIFDHYENKWIDFSSTIFVANVGHANNRIIRRVKEMLDKPLVHSYAYPNKIRAQYLEKLLDFAGDNFQKAFLLSAGTEATEGVLKLMRMYGQEQSKRNLGIICIEGNWHGRTMGAQLMSNNEDQKKWIGFNDENIHHLPFPYPWEKNIENPLDFLRRSFDKLSKKGIDLSKDICGVMLETFQGWGALYYPKDYVKEMELICKKYNILLAFDEMQSGFSRTGFNFGYEYYGVKPDLIACGKGMGGGMVISGVIGKREIMDLPEVGNMSSTHSANPISCAAALGVLEEIEDLNLTNVTKSKGKLLHKCLEELRYKYPEIISNIYGEGLIAAIHLNKKIDNIGTLISEKCFQKGLLVVHTGRESIKIGPPLTIDEAAIMEGVSVIGEAIEEILK